VGGVVNFFNELKRRNVFRVGVAYLFGGWLLLQLTDVLSQLLELPAVVGRVVVLAVTIGLPIVLFIAWAFELTPEGVKREKNIDRSESITHKTGKRLNHVILTLMAITITYLLLDKFSETAEFGQGQSPGQTTSDGTESVPGTEPAMADSKAAISLQSIAVLPFDNRSNLEEDEFFVEGVHDDLLTNLAKISSLKVISRTSVARYKNTEVPIPEIARELGVATIMEGAVQRAGDTVRINVQLIDAQTDEHLWAEIFDRELTTENLFAIQTEISREIALALKTTLSPEEQQRVNDLPTENLAAYSAYLRGRQLIARNTAEAVDQALVEFQRAVDLDPQFALAWVGIAEAARLALRVSDMNLPESIQLTQEAVEKALAINDQLGEVHLARASLIQLKRGDDVDREAALKLAIELSPGNAQAWQEYSAFASRFPSRLEEALDLAEKAANLDPLSPAIQNQMIRTLRSLGDHEAARQRLSRLIEQHPGYAAAYEQMSNLYSEAGQFHEAIHWIHQAQSLDPGNIGFVMREMWPQMDIGNTDGFDHLLGRMEVMDPNSSTLSFMEMWISIFRKDFDAAIEAARLFDQKTGYRPGGKFPQAIVHIQRNDPAAFRAIAEEVLPAFYDSDTFAQGLDDRPYMGCRVAWSLAQTGDETLGWDLARLTIEYFRNNISMFDEDFALGLCHMVLNQPDQALQLIENTVRSGKIGNWWLDLSYPAYDLLRHDPRFVAAETEIQSIIARQRETLKQMESEGEP
jgi:TolB-like protein